ncbi:MAG TPA: FAD-binding oxidoreductase [Candidatus Stackebrandtia faecavium]|nr:FAD-binding oxidoreductase [Candidatus Stackebrandtia faecavium]
MTQISERIAGYDELDIERLRAALDSRVEGEVRFDAGSRAAYATDASNYRQMPIGVVLPYTVDAVVEAIAVCRDHAVPVLARGGGTSLAGQCCNVAVVLDLSKYCCAVVSLDQEHRTAIVEPGIVLDELNRELAAHGLMVGPKPSTHPTCTIGGMIGNNSCGSSAQQYGKMSDSVLRLEVLTYDGTRMWVGATSDNEYAQILSEGGRLAELYRQLRALRDEYMADIRTNYPSIPRRVSGYNLDSLLPENGFDVAKALTGSENTLVTVLRAEIQLFDKPHHRSLVVLGYENIIEAARAVPTIDAHDPAAVEGLDDRLIELERQKHLADDALAKLPVGSGWLMIQFHGDDRDDVKRRADALIEDVSSGSRAPTVAYLDDPAMEDELWKVRESGLGASAYPLGVTEARPGWEDSAVDPARLANYLDDFSNLLEEFGYQEAPLYGHFGHGCLHTRIPFDLTTEDGIAHFHQFTRRAGQLVVSYGGSLSGEHGDGQCRSELLELMFGPRVSAAFSRLKRSFDPSNLMNPGKIVDPSPMDEHLRKGAGYRPAEPQTHFAYPHTEFRFSQAAARCVGVGKCRGHDGGVMCPSYRATREEEHSTRGRSRLLFEMLQGDVITDGWRSTEVLDALDLCLACKGCKSDCPVNVDMATYKAEFLSHHYAGRVRPLSHYSMGWLPLWSRIASQTPKAVNAVAQHPKLASLIKRLGGIAMQRSIPAFAEERFSDWFRRRAVRRTERTKVVLWPDTFHNNLHPEIARAAHTVLSAAGFDPVVPSATLCCGLTWVSTGQLRTAKRVLRRTLRVLEPALRAGTPIVVLEPSCAAMFRSDLPDLLYGDEDAKRLSTQVHTLSEFLRSYAPHWHTPPAEVEAIAQVHCHQHAVLGFDADQELMHECGIEVETLDEGCCGLAGNFGFEKDHYEVSMAVADQGFLQAARDAGPKKSVIADGFSCRTQLAQANTGVQAAHLAEVLAEAVRKNPENGGPSRPLRAVVPCSASMLGERMRTTTFLGARSRLCSLAVNALDERYLP